MRLLGKLVVTAAALAAGVSLGAWLRRRGGVVFQLRADDPPPIPPWPAGGAPDPLEESFGADADALRLLTPQALEMLRNGEEVAGTPPNFNFGQPGEGGVGQPPTPDWVSRYVTHRSNGTWNGRKDDRPPLPDCGRVWIFHFIHEELTGACAGFNYAAAYRATLLRAISEAYRLCREQKGNACPLARVWLLYAKWNCTPEPPGPTVAIRLKLAVACVDS